MSFGRSLVIATVILSLSSILWAAPPQDQKQEARAFAESVLKMKDAKQFHEIYRDKFHASMRQQMTEDQWLAAAESVAKQAGPLKSRTLDSSPLIKALVFLSSVTMRYTKTGRLATRSM